jgi:hypothetical protein
VAVPVAALGAAAPPAVSVAQGGSGTVAIAFTRTNFAGDVTVSLEDALAGISAAAVTAPAGAFSAELACASPRASRPGRTR